MTLPYDPFDGSIAPPSGTVDQPFLYSILPMNDTYLKGNSKYPDWGEPWSKDTYVAKIGSNGPRSFYPETIFPGRMVYGLKGVAFEFEENPITDQLYQFWRAINPTYPDIVDNYLRKGFDGIQFNGRLRTTLFPTVREVQNCVNVIQVKFKQLVGKPPQWWLGIETIPFNNLDIANVKSYLIQDQTDGNSVGDLDTSENQVGHPAMVPIVSAHGSLWLPAWLAEPMTTQPPVPPPPPPIQTFQAKEKLGKTVTIRSSPHVTGDSVGKILPYSTVTYLRVVPDLDHPGDSNYQWLDFGNGTYAACVYPPNGLRFSWIS